MNHNLNVMDADDMQFCPYLVSDNLPSLLKDCLSTVKSTNEQDILLLSLLTASSACLPNVVFRYGHTGKVYHPNLQTFIMAGAASGKGIAGLALDLVRPLHEKRPLIILGDSTYPAFFQILHDQGGIGYLHESEGSVITDVWRSGTATYNTALRKASEHEPISRNRMFSGTSVIEKPCLSMLLTGTFDQFRTLVPSVHNGFFSRLTAVVIRGRQSFDPQAFRAESESYSAIESAGQHLLQLHAKLFERAEPVRFRLTERQAADVGSHFQHEYGALVEALGDNFHPSVVRAGITMMRIASVLTAWRKASTGETIEDEWVCSEEDYQTAILLSSKLLLHAADAYQQIEDCKVAAVPSTESSLQKVTLLALLPEHFTTGESVACAKRIGIGERTIKRWLNQWAKCGQLTHIQHGEYKKVS